MQGRNVPKTLLLLTASLALGPGHDLATSHTLPSMSPRSCLMLSGTWAGEEEEEEEAGGSSQGCAGQGPYWTPPLPVPWSHDQSLPSEGRTEISHCVLSLGSLQGASGSVGTVPGYSKGHIALSVRCP